jgi:hypothetical protein
MGTRKNVLENQLTQLEYNEMNKSTLSLLEESQKVYQQTLIDATRLDDAMYPILHAVIRPSSRHSTSERPTKRWSRSRRAAKIRSTGRRRTSTVCWRLSPRRCSRRSGSSASRCPSTWVSRGGLRSRRRRRWISSDDGMMHALVYLALIF